MLVFEANESDGAMEITRESFRKLIYVFRGQQVMLDSDLAAIYGYATKDFNRQVKNNFERFDEEDLMFQLNDEEVEILRCKNSTSSSEDSWGGRRYAPYVFTEQGVYMLMAVLKGPLAVKQSKSLVRLFKQMKDFIVQNQPLLGQRELLQLSLQTSENIKDVMELRSSLARLDDKVAVVVDKMSEMVTQSQLSEVMLDFGEPAVRRGWLILNGSYRITEDTKEIVMLGRQIAAEHPLRYPERIRGEFVHKFWDFLPDEEELSSLWYNAVYHQQLYGTSVMDYFTFRFEQRTHAEKVEYVTWYGRFVYMAFLNRDRDLHLLDNKFEAYRLLKPFYKREAILVGGWEDFEAFREFVGRHGRVFVKPVNLELAEGVHRLVVGPGEDLRVVFESLLEEAAGLGCEDVTRPVEHKLILEEELVQSEEMAQFNPQEMSVLRVTTVLVKGQVHFFYPVFRMMCGDGEERKGEMYSYDALIDAESGELVTNGIESRGEVECHPVTGMKIKGFRMPQWEELKAMLEEAARMLPGLRYIGWDVAHTDRGWCIIEGNTNGEFFFQMCVGHGVKREFEDLIGFHVPFGFMLEEVEQLIDKRKSSHRRR